MLFKKTVKVAAATALWMVALLGANSAMAQNLLTDDPPTFSAETLAASATGMYAVASTDQINVRLAVDSRTAYLMAEGRGVQFRVEGTGVLRLNAAPTLDLVTQTPAAGGTPAGPLVAAASPATMVGALPTGNAWRLDQGTAATANVVAVDILATAAAVTGMGTGTIKLTTYSGTETDRQDDAHFGEGSPLTDNAGTALVVARSAEVKIAGGAVSKLTASAAHRFTQFIDPEGQTVSPVSLGGFDVQIMAGHLNAAGNTLLNVAINAADSTYDVTGATDATPEQLAMGRAGLFGVVGIGATAGARFYGDGGFGFVKSFQIRSNADCGAGTGTAKPAGAIKKSPVAKDEDNQSDDVQTALAIDPWYLCATVDAENDSAISEGDYMMDVMIPVAPGNLQPFPAMGATGLVVANVGHDGTTAHIPYVTTFENYNQRLVIVNRAKDPIYFTVSFQTEDGVMADPGATDRMMVGGGETSVMQMSKLVTFTGGTRGSATVVLEAAPPSVGVATTIVHRMTGATDTIIVH